MPFVILVGCLLLFGFFPRLLADKIQASVAPMLTMVGTAAAQARAEAHVPLNPDQSFGKRDNHRRLPVAKVRLESALAVETGMWIP